VVDQLEPERVDLRQVIARFDDSREALRDAMTSGRQAIDEPAGGARQLGGGLLDAFFGLGLGVRRQPWSTVLGTISRQDRGRSYRGGVPVASEARLW
jgi:hypothetical protein